MYRIDVESAVLISSSMKKKCYLQFYEWQQYDLSNTNGWK